MSARKKGARCRSRRSRLASRRTIRTGGQVDTFELIDGFLPRFLDGECLGILGNWGAPERCLRGGGRLATVQAYLSNAQRIPTDCPHGERNGWTGDSHLGQRVPPDRPCGTPRGLDAVGGTAAPFGLTSTAYLYADARIVARAARLLGRGDEAAKYDALAETLKCGFGRRFLEPGSGEARPASALRGGKDAAVPLDALW